MTYVQDVTEFNVKGKQMQRQVFVAGNKKCTEFRNKPL